MADTFLTEEMVVADNQRIFETELGDMREALLTINRYCLDLLSKGKLLVVNEQGNIRLWEGETQ